MTMQHENGDDDDGDGNADGDGVSMVEPAANRGQH